MTKQAILLQDTAVSKIINLLQVKDEITFKAPTGSGKTVMIAKLMNELFETDKNIVFFVSSLSKCGLAEQNDNTFQEFKRTFKNIDPYLIDSSSSTEQSGAIIEYDHNVYTIPRDLTRKGGKIMSGPLSALIYNIGLRNKKIILIKDECHQAQNNIDVIADNHKFYKKINLSATPQTSKFNIDVEITDNEAIEAKLIKPYEIKGNGNGYDIDKYAELNEAIKAFKKVRTQYEQSFNINPCLLIQIPNSLQGEAELAHLKQFLNKEEMQIKWMYMCDDLKQWDTNDKIKLINKNQWKNEWKRIAKLPNSQIDVIIFKMVITEGWDIKRANMLFQIRETDSETLTEQVIGRIRRNPILLNWSDYSDKQQSIALQSYVWGNVKDKDREFKRVKSVDNPKIEIQTTILDNLKEVYRKQQFDLRKFIDKKTLTNVSNIFELYKNWSSIEEDTYKMTWENIKTYSDWMKFSNFIQEIDHENKRLLKDYKNSIKIDKKVNLPPESYFEILKTGPNNMQFGPCDIDVDNDKFGWKIISDKDDIDFFFDSQAECEFANKIKRIGKKVWTKNFYPNSQMSFEYINVTKKKSFPDFVLLDKNNHYHIFEVKSFNLSRTHNIHPEEYNEKVMALREFYKELADKTNYTFYIPIKYHDDWIVYKYQKGDEEERTIGEIIENINLN